MEHINQVKAVTSLIVSEVLKNPNSILSITSILLTLTIRVEAHEYELDKILQNMNKLSGMNIDIKDILSIESKVKKGK